MIPRTRVAVNRNLILEWGKGLLIPMAILLAACLLFASQSVSAGEARPDNAVGFYIKDGETHWIVPGDGVDVTQGNYSPSELEALYPMSPEAEKAIVHDIPPCPVIIDGVTYKPQDISLFSGVRLRFVLGNDGRLYAFTTVAGLEKFLAEQKDAAKDTDPLISIFYEDWWYGGYGFGMDPGNGFPVLSQIGYDNCVSSCKISALCSDACLFDGTYYSGDYFVMQPGSNHSALSLEGWNDRASSVYVYD